MPDPPPNRRGLFSCLHSKCDVVHGSGSRGKDTTEVLHDLLVGIYGEAFDRLPFEGLQAEDAEKLVTAMCTGGVCVGLLDPVSNIILNTISVLPRDFPHHQPEPTPPPRRSKRLKTQPRKLKRRRQPDYVWSYISSLSCHSLVRFLVRYFGCLTPQQAARYLLHADANLPLAVMLVDHDLYAAAVDQQPQLLDPASDRTQAALKCAAMTGRHPSPDALVRLHTSPLPHQRLIPAAPFLNPAAAGRRNLTLDDVKMVTELLRYQESASLDLQVNFLPDTSGVVVYRRDLTSEEGKLIHHNASSLTVDGGVFDVFTIKVERHGSNFASLLDKDTTMAAFLEKLNTASRAAGSSLNNCGDACEYTQSLKMRLHRMIHAFYLRVFTMLPSTVSHRLVRYILFAGHCYGPMDPVSNIILSSIWHSIVFPLPSPDSESQVAYDILDTLAMLRVEVRSLEGLLALVIANFGCSTQQAMAHLCFKSCHLRKDMHCANGYRTAAKAAQHPQHAALGSFLSSPMLDRLQPLLSTRSGILSTINLDQVERLVNIKFGRTAVKFAPEAELYKTVKDNLLLKRSEYDYLRLFIRSELATVLKKYAYEHPQEPKYVPSVVCGVVGTHYKPNFCRRLCLTHTGRCYYGQTSSIKIMYPDSSDYFECDITCDGIKQADMMLEADFVLDCRRDGQFAEAVVKYYEDWNASSEVDW